MITFLKCVCSVSGAPELERDLPVGRIAMRKRLKIPTVCIVCSVAQVQYYKTQAKPR